METQWIAIAIELVLLVAGAVGFAVKFGSMKKSVESLEENKRELWRKVDELQKSLNQTLVQIARCNGRKTP